MKRLAHFLLFVAAIQLMGGHWLMLQSVAWTGMLVTYSQKGSFTNAVEKTFDGAHPCGLCKAISEAKKTEQEKSPISVSLLKQDCILPAKISLLHPPCSKFIYPVFAPDNISVVYSPLLRPPRSA